MSDQIQCWQYAEEVVIEPEIIATARDVATDFGIRSISAATGNFLTMLMKTAGVKNVVEVGTGTGISGMYMLRSGNIHLTTLDTESEAQHAARDFFTKDGARPGRVRLINGRSADLLPRLASASYDCVVIDGDPLEAPGDVDEAMRLLRPGGLIVILHALQGGKIADPARREEKVVAIRGLIKDMNDAENIDTTLVPIGDGVLVARLTDTTPAGKPAPVPSNRRSSFGTRKTPRLP
ncbi:O-methyltransferase [Actinotignum urinale]|uniref:O-methyltransferase n=1 Tax=Actinotignum urinale TaxID=190146 RepID=UPI00370D0371